MPSREQQKQHLRTVITGKVVNAENVTAAMREWRERFGVSQRDLAEHMGVRASVLSDYERGRRENPGVDIVAEYVGSLLDLSDAEGGEAIRFYNSKYVLRERTVEADAPTA